MADGPRLSRRLVSLMARLLLLPLPLLLLLCRLRRGLFTSLHADLRERLRAARGNGTEQVVRCHRRVRLADVDGLEGGSSHVGLDDKVEAVGEVSLQEVDELAYRRRQQQGHDQ